LIEQDKQEKRVNEVDTYKLVDKNPLKKRTAEQKVGRQKLHEIKTNKVFLQNERILEQLRWIRVRLERIGEADFSLGDIEGFAVQDEVDREIVQRVREAGTPGVLPKDVAVDVNLRGNFNLKYYDVSRRILRMNKRLHFETEKCLFEKRGHHWALTKFAFDSYEASGDAIELSTEGLSQTGSEFREEG
jgi:hypothetical protein